jgi:CubicO group peptidase (beta-lactamase class C family)
MDNREVIEKKFNNFTCSKQIHEAVLLIENSSGGFSANFGYGGKTIDTPFQAASVGKLFTTACVLMLQEQRKLSLNNLVADYFDKTLMNGLHKYKGVDYSHKLTLSDLLFQTSGLPDYEYAAKGGVVKRAIKEDFAVSTVELIEITKTLKPRFAPLGKKAYYSDLNFQLLGEVVEKVTQSPLEEIFRNYLFEPLGLTKTYMPVNNDFVSNVYYKNQSLHLPKMLMSLRGGGNAITTARELMIFLKAFFNGYFFPKDLFEKLSVYRKLQITMTVIYYGGGYMQIPLNCIFTLFMGKGELIGHSGSTGSFAFYYPHKDLFFVGDVNQLANPGLPIQLVMKLAKAVK